jgi:tetratricopeptide (TPR) repeat protein
LKIRYAAGELGVSGPHDNRFDGDAATAFQMRDVSGGVHQHHHNAPRRLVAPARQGLPPPRHYTNNESQLNALSKVFRYVDGADGPRIAIIRGAPGSGRSTLAHAWLYYHGADFPDGQFLVRLAGSGADVEQTRVALGEMLGAVGYDPDQIPASLDGRSAAWRSWSTDRRIAVIVDDAVTPAQVSALMPGRGRSVVLAIEAGRLAGLKARATAEYVTIDPLSDASARRLLGRMAGEGRTAAAPDPVRRLIDRCGGSATALCVVGALLAEFVGEPIARLAARLVDDEWALRELSRDRDLSLTVVFDAAYRRLDPLGQKCYQLLGAHPHGGDVALETIAAVLGEPVDEVAYALRGLLRAMLVTEPTEDRYLMTGLLRVHARAKAGSDAKALRQRVLAWYRDRALAASLAWLPDRGWLQQLWGFTVPTDLDKDAARRWLEAERANLRAVVESTAEPVWACQLAIALWPLHDEKKFAYDMATVDRLGADAARLLGDPLAESVIECQHGFAYRQREDLTRAAELFTVAREAAARADSLPALATALESLGLARVDQDRRAEAEELLRENLAIAARINELVDDRRRLALARFHLAKVVSPEEARALLAQARQYFESRPSPEAYNLVKIDLWRGIKLAEDGRLDEAAELLADVSTEADTGSWHFERAQAREALDGIRRAPG